MSGPKHPTTGTFTTFSSLSLVCGLALGTATSFSTTATAIPTCRVDGATKIRELSAQTTEFGRAGYVIDQPGHYELDLDLVLEGLDIGVLVVADNVTLDLSGHALRDPSFEATLIDLRAAAPRAEIRNGHLTGGLTGIHASGDRSSPVFDSSSIALHTLRIETLEGVSLDNIASISAHTVDVVATRTAFSATEYKTLQATHSSFRSVSVGLSTFPLTSGNAPAVSTHVSDTTLSAPRAADSHGPTVFQRNNIMGKVTLESNGSRIAHNVFAGHHEGGLHLTGAVNFVTDNSFRLGGGSPMVLLGTGNRLVSNHFWIRDFPISVDGSYNSFEHNTVIGRPGVCWASFSAADNTTRANALRPGSMRVCGFAPLEAAELTKDDGQSSKPDMAVSTWTTDRASCPSEQSILIHSTRPVDTPHGRAALLINTPGHYLLAQDLVLPGAPIIIDASDVTLDLNGYSLSCSGVCEQMLYAPTDGQVSLKNGMIRGGVITLSVINSFRLALQDLYLECTDAPNCYGLSAFGVHTVDIYAVIVKGIENSALISARGGSITGSVFQAVEDGLSAVFAEGALIQGNLFRADVALELSGDNIVTHNAIVSSSFGVGITMLGGRSSTRRNFIDARGGIAIALHDGNHIIADNNIDGGGILIGSGNNEIMGNMLIDTQMLNESNSAISVLSMGNTLAENLIVRHRCGLMFAAGNNSYRDNIALAVEEGVCGQENIDAGGNLFPTPTCGNHLRGGTEVCDGSDLGFHSCESLGFSRGNLGCSTMCDAYDTSGCVP